MGLRIKLAPDERLIVNGCIIRNGNRRTEIEIENRADVLRGGEMLDEESARTPVRRLCYLVQIALVSPTHRAALMPDILLRIDQIASIMERSHGSDIAEIRSMVSHGEFYAASRRLQPVIEHEDMLLKIASTTFRGATDAGHLPVEGAVA